MDDYPTLKQGILGKREGEFRIALNTASKDIERCNVCEGNTGWLAGGSRRPLEIFGPYRISCPKCCRLYAPKLANILDEYYASHPRKTHRPILPITRPDGLTARRDAKAPQPYGKDRLCPLKPRRKFWSVPDRSTSFSLAVQLSVWLQPWTAGVFQGGDEE